MPYCPNCSNQVSSDQKTCVICGAEFGPQSAWKPSSQPVGTPWQPKTRRVREAGKIEPVTLGSKPTQSRHIGRIFLSIILVLIYLAAVPEYGGPADPVIYIPLLIVVIILFRVIERSGIRASQQGRTTLAKELFSKPIPTRQKAFWNPTTKTYDMVSVADTGAFPPVYFYLRSFDVDNVYVTNPEAKFRKREKSLLPFYGHGITPYISLDEAITLALSQEGNSATLFALNADQRHIGALGIQVSDSGWQDQFTRLLSVSSLVIVVPGETPGTTWEIEQLLSTGAISKAIFLLLPQTLRNEVMKTPISWGGMLAAMSGAGLKVNNGDSSPLRPGDAVRFDRTGQIVARTEGVLQKDTVTLRFGIAELRRALFT